MATVYKKNNKIYISFYDPSIGRGRDRSTGLEYNRENLKLAKQIADQLQSAITKQSEQFKSLGIERVTIDTAFQHFKNINADKNLKTIKEYDWFYKRFTEKFSIESSCTIITKLSTESWLADIRKLSYQKNTLYSYCKVLKKFLGFLFEYNYTPVFKINKDMLIKPEVKQIITFSNEDMKKYFNNMQNKNPNFQTTMYLLFYTGLRPSDIYNLKVEDINLENNTFQYYSEKSKEYFSVPIHKDLIPILKTRISQVEMGNLINYETINNIGKAFRRYLSQIKLKGKGYNLRTFRKTFITLAHSNGMDLATVSKLVGHKQITTTAKFYNKLSITKQSNELNKLNLKMEITKNDK